MLNVAYTNASVVLVIFHYCVVQNKQSNSTVRRRWLCYLHIQ